MPKSSEMPPEDYQLEENEERSMIEPKSYENPRLQELIKVLIEWINDELHEDRIIVQVNKQTNKLFFVKLLCPISIFCRLTSFFLNFLFR